MGSIKYFINLILWGKFLFSVSIAIGAYVQDYNLVVQDTIVPPASASIPEIIDIIEIPAAYPEGQDSLLNFIYSNLKWPVDFCGEGTVVISFIIDKEGYPSDYVIRRSVYKTLDQEALRVLKLIKKWIPGRQAGVPVKQQYNFPVRFRLE